MEDCLVKAPEKKKKIYKRPKRRHNVAFADFAINSPRSSFQVSCTLLFAMCQLFCGIVIPLSDSFVTTSDSRLGHAYYLEGFLIIQYVLATICVFYLQIYIFICEKKQKQVKSEREMNSDYDSRKRKESEVILKNDNMDVTDSPKVTFDLKSEEGCSNLNNVNQAINELSITSIQTDDYYLNSLKNSYPSSEVSSIASQSFEKYPIVRDHEGINLYLRLGAVGFGFGVMVHDGFKIADKFRLEGDNCHNELWAPKHVLHLTYIFIQTFFVFKYHRVIFLKHKATIRFILYNLVTSNICQWFKTVVYEINHKLIEHHLLQNMKTNETDTYSNCSQQLSYTVSPYLFPCSIEYSLISAAIFYKMLQKVGRKYKEPHFRDKYNAPTEESRVKYSECHRSHRGLFIGLFFFMVTLVGVAIFFLFRKKIATKALSILVYQSSEIILLMSGIITLIWAFIKMRSLQFRQLTEEQALDDNLLLIGLAGVFSYNLFLFISTIDSFIRLDNPKYSLIIILFILKSLTEIIQSSIQVLFVLESSRKGIVSEIQVKLKPGRSLVTFVIVINLALWIVSIFEAKRSDEHLIFTKYYQKTPWSIITHTLLPLIIFFRFHSSICLMDIWSKTYRVNRKT